MTKEKAQTSSGQPPLYKPAGFYMLRAPTLSADIFKRITSAAALDMDGCLREDEASFHRVRQDGYDTLHTLSADPAVQRALLLASVDMLEGLEHMQHKDLSPKRFERMYSGILRYLVRMSTRPTPFGLFSGVAVGTLAEQTTVQLGTPAVKSTRTRPDMGWLLALIQRVEENEELRPSLTVVANHTAYIAGPRAIIPYADVYGKGDNRAITLRATSVVQYVLLRAREPIPYQTLQKDILFAFPSATMQQVDGLLQQLWQHHFLTSDLRPPLTSADPENYVLERLLQIPQARELALSLKNIVDAIEKIDQAGLEADTTQVKNVMERQRALAPYESKQLLQTDTSLRLETPQLNSEIGVAVAEAVGTLLKMTSFPHGLSHLREYFNAFVERYGMHVEVPLLDLLSPEIGLGAPGTYMEPPRDFPFPVPAQPSPGKQALDTVLSSLFAEALYNQKIEVELTDDLVQALTQWTPDPENPQPPAMEMYLQIHAVSRAALDRGEWRGVLTNQSLGGRTFCRFFDLLGKDELTMLQAYAKQEEAFAPDCIFAELSYLPKLGHGANVIIRPPLRDYEIVLNTMPSVSPEQVLPLQDLVVGVKGERFYIRSLSQQKAVKVTQSHMLNLGSAPNICRFLLEVSQDGQPQLMLFSWGALSHAPFLPRVVRKKMVFSPAQWNVSQASIESTGPGDEKQRFFTGVQRWRERWHVPRYVYMSEFDNRLLLDLEHPLLVAELQHELKKRGTHTTVTLQEMVPDFEHLWLHDQQGAPYMAELVIPVIAQAQTGAQPADAHHKSTARGSAKHPPSVLPDLERRCLPGEEWTYLKLYVLPRQQDEIIAGPLREIVHTLQQQQLIDRWFFIRYVDPEPHLRVRFHARNEQVRNAVLVAALTWGSQLVRAGRLRNSMLDTYTREIERYGGPQAIALLEEVFTVSSLSLADVIAAMYQGEITLDPLTVAVFTLDQVFSMWGMDLSDRLQYIRQYAGQYDGKELFRPRRRQLCELLAPWESDPDPSLMEQRTLLLRLCAPQEPLLQRASARIKALAASGNLWVEVQELLASLAHMHCNRLLGISHDAERQGYAFWRHTLESIARRPARGEPLPPRKREISSRHASLSVQPD